MFKTHFFWFIYLLTVVCAGGWYVTEQKQTIADQERTIQELTATQRPPILPTKRKIVYRDKIVEKKVPVKDEKCVEEYEILRQKTIQCAYNLQACQTTSEVYNQLRKEQNE